MFDGDSAFCGNTFEKIQSFNKLNGNEYHMNTLFPWKS